jgi:hypothetical protein
MTTSRLCGRRQDMPFTKNEWIALLVGILLAAISTMADSVPAITIGWSLVGIILCYLIYSQEHFAETYRIMLCIAAIVLGRWFIYVLTEAKIERDAHQIFGTLFPSNMNTSGLSFCQNTGGIAIYIGANTDCATQFPLPLLTIDGDPIITLDKTSRGEIVITYLLLNDENELNLASITAMCIGQIPTLERKSRTTGIILLSIIHRAKERWLSSL